LTLLTNQHTYLSTRIFSMAEVNLFDASSQHSNEAAVAATPAVSDSMNHMSTTVASVNDGHGPNKLSETSSAGSSDQTKDKTRPDDDDNLEDAEKKRKRFLERNRVAAYKCRQKKKAWMQELEAKSEEATKRNRELHMLVNQLKEEAIQLKNQLVSKAMVIHCLYTCCTLAYAYHMI
jgi:hypothetical protein